LAFPDPAIVTTVQPTTNTTASITGLSFAPTVLKLFWNGRTADGGAADCSTGIGFAANTPGEGTTQAALWTTSDDNVPTSVVNGRVTASACVLITAPDGTVLGSAVVSSWNSDGVTLTWSNVDGVQRLVNVVCEGGDQVGKAGATARPTVAGNQTVTVGAFTPAAMLAATAGDFATALDTNFVNSCSVVLGCTDGSGQWATGWGERHGRADGDGLSYMRLDQMLAAFDAGAGVMAEANWVSFDSTSGGRFTVNWTVVNTRAGYYIWLALGGTGMSYKQGMVAADTDAGGQSVTGVGFRPQAGQFASIRDTTNFVLSSKLSLGAAVSSSQRFALSAFGEFGAATLNESQYLKRDKVMLFGAPSHGSPTLDGEADFTSWDSDGYTWNWTDASPAAYFMVYFVYKGTAAAAQDAPELRGRPMGLRGQQHMNQLLSQ
jgi:hypothetical protein